MRCEVVVSGVLVGKSEFPEVPRPGDMITTDDGQVVVKNLLYDMRANSRKPRIFCDPAETPLEVQENPAEEPINPETVEEKPTKAASEVVEEEATAETPTEEPAPEPVTEATEDATESTQPIRRGRRRS